MEGRRRGHCLLVPPLLVLVVLCHVAARGSGAQTAEDAAGAARLGATSERDVSTPLATVPVVTNPAAALPTATPTPSLANPVAGGGSWCVASPSAGAAALQVALDYACGQGGADCSAIQTGASCFEPDTVRDHASYAFNSYYQKNPVQTSCDFAGAAVLTSTDPSTSTCRYPSTSTGASVLNTTAPLTPAYGYPPGGSGSSPPGYGTGSGSSPPLYGSMSPPDYGGNVGAAAAIPGTVRLFSPALTTTCLLIAALSLN